MVLCTPLSTRETYTASLWSNDVPPALYMCDAGEFRLILPQTPFAGKSAKFQPAKTLPSLR